MNSPFSFQNIKSVLFDLDDTLIGSERIYNTIYTELSLDKKLFAEARSAVKHTLGPGHVAARNRLLYFKKYLELRQDFSVDKLWHLNDQYEEKLQNLIESDLQQSNNLSVLLNLASKFRLGIITNENLRTQILKLRKIDPRQEIFSFIVTSEEIGIEKPGTKIIDRAIQLARTMPENILMVGDSLTNDLIPFKEKGCHCIGTKQFRNESTKQTKQNQFIWIDNMSALLECK